MGVKGFQRLKDGRYRAQPRDPVTGRRRSITCRTLGELESKLRRLNQIREELRYGDTDPRKAQQLLRPVLGGRLTLRELWERYAPGIPPRSQSVARSTYERRIKPYLGDRALFELDEATLRAWASKLEAETFAPKTIRAAYDYIAGCVGMAIDSGDISEFPWRAWRPRKAERLVEPERCRNIQELLSLLQAARTLDEKDWSEGRWADRAIRIAVIALCGLRQGEACGLAWDHCDLVNGMIHIEFQAARGWQTRWPDGRPKDPPKTKPRRIRLHASAIEALRLQQAALGERGWLRSDGPVFPNTHGAWRTTSRCIKPEHLREIVELADLPNVDAWRTHSLRHTFATLEVLGSGGDLVAAQRRTGHSSLKQLAGYLASAGRGIPESSIAALPEGSFATADSDLAAELAEAQKAREHATEERTAAHDERIRESKKPFEELAHEWLTNGRRPLPRPPAVTRAVRSAYVRAYKTHLATSKPAHGARWERLSAVDKKLLEDTEPELAQLAREDLERRLDAAREAGRRARRASLGAWGQAVKRAERARTPNDDAAE